MKKEVIIIFLIGILLVSPFVLAQESQTYSGFDRFADNIKLFFSGGDNKVMLALEIREKELNSATNNLKLGEENKAKKEIESAINMLKIIQLKTTPEIADEVRNNIKETEYIIKENLNLEFFEKYLTEEQKTKLVIEHSEKIFDYCEELAKQDYELMLKDEKCQNNAPDWLEDEVNNKIKEVQKQDSEEIKKQIEITMNNPKNSDCDEISLTSERARCEKFKALAIRCEFQNDESACEEIGMFKDVQTNEREDYEKEIIEKYLPAECSEAGVRDGEECKKLILTLNQPETECMKNGEYIGDENCKDKLVNQGNVVEECVIDGKLVDPEQCLNIVKEKNKPTGEEFELMSGECKEMGIYDPVACEEIVNLPKPCKDAGYYTKKECESMTLNQNFPKECVDAGALTPEACEKLKLPSDCQGAYSREECEQIKIEQKFPDECKSVGELDPKKCAIIMVGGESLVVTAGAEMEYLVRQGLAFEEIPSACMSGKNFIRSMDCDAELAKLGITLPTPTDTGGIPMECMVDERTAVSPQECQNRIEKNIIIDTIPKECQNAEVTNPEECGIFIEEKRIEEGIGINMPEECMGVSVEECKTIMKEKGIEIEKIEQVQRVEKVKKMCKEGEVCEEEPTEYEEVTLPKECIEMGVSDITDCKMIAGRVNEERIKNGEKVIVDENGKVDYLHPEQIEKIADDADKKSNDIKPDITKADEIKQQIDVIDNSIKTIDLQELEITSENNVVDKPEMDKDNEDVTPAPNVVDNNIAPGSEGIVGYKVVEPRDDSAPSNSIDNSNEEGGDSGGDSATSDSGDSEGDSAPITGEVVRNYNNITNKIFNWLF